MDDQVIKTVENVESEKKTIQTKCAAALYTLWFGLDYGSILIAYALYQTVEQLGKKSYLIEKPTTLWSDHYADKENIAGKFIYKNCDVIEAFSDDTAANALKAIDTHIVGSDVVWDCKVVGEQTKGYFYLENVTEDNVNKIAYGSSIGCNFDIPIDKRNDYALLLNKFNALSVKSFEESLSLTDMFYVQPEIVADPVFLCERSCYMNCAERSVAKEVELGTANIFTYIKNGDFRKKDLVLRGYKILMEKWQVPLRNFIDINRYPESKEALGLEPAYHILVEDWLYYLINSKYVITDDYYGMCFAILFNKDFVVVAGRDMKDLSRYNTLLEQLDLSERMIYLDDDFKTKEYLFRKPIRYREVNEKLEKIKDDSYKWLKEAIYKDGKG